MKEIFTITVKNRTNDLSSTNNDNQKHYPKATALGLGILQLVLGFLSALLGVIELVIDSPVPGARMGAGVWFGVIFVVSGSAGILSWRHWCQRSFIQLFFVLTVLAALGGVSLAVVASVGLSQWQHHDPRIDEEASAKRGMPHTPIHLLIVAVLETIVATAAAVMCSRSLLRCLERTGPRRRSPEEIIVREVRVVPTAGIIRFMSPQPDLVVNGAEPVNDGPPGYYDSLNNGFNHNIRSYVRSQTVDSFSNYSFSDFDVESINSRTNSPNQRRSYY